MQTYELTYIIADSVADESTADVMQQVSKELEKHGAVIMKEESWGRRKLAYPIKKSNYGTYVTLQTHLEGGKVKEVDRFLLLNASIIRHLMLIATQTVTKPTDEAELAQALDKRVEETVAKKPGKKKADTPAEVTEVAQATANETETTETGSEVEVATEETPTAPKPATAGGRTRKPKASTEDDKKAENEAERKKLVEEKLNEILGE